MKAHQTKRKMYVGGGFKNGECGMWIGADWSLDPCVPPRSSEQRYFPMHSTGVKPESGISQCRGHGSIRAHTQSSESKQSSKLFRDNCVYPDWSEGSFPSPQSQRERRRIDRRKQIVDKGCLEENTSLLHAQYCAINSVYKKVKKASGCIRN